MRSVTVGAVEVMVKLSVSVAVTELVTEVVAVIVDDVRVKVDVMLSMIVEKAF